MYSLVKQIDQGGLVYPAIPAVNAVADNNVVVNELSKRAAFLKSPTPMPRGRGTRAPTAQRRGAFRLRRL